MVTRFLICSILLLSLCSTAFAQSLNETVFITEQLPPYNYKENGKIQGISVDILREALAAVGIKLNKAKLHIYPWARGYKTVIQTPNSCIFSTARNSSREKSFKWVGPITNVTHSFYTLNKKIKAKSITDLEKYRITTARQSIGHYILKKSKFPKNKIDLSNDPLTMVKKLKRGRADLILENEIVLHYTARKEGMEWSNFINIYSVNLGEIYFAFNKETPDHIVKKLQKGIDIIRENGKLEGLLNRLYSLSE